MTRALPFPMLADVIERPDTIIKAGVPCAIWPAPGRAAPAGMHYDHEGEAHPDSYDDLSVANRVLRSAGREYVIVTATAHPYFPHVALTLRATAGSRN